MTFNLYSPTLSVPIPTSPVESIVTTWVPPAPTWSELVPGVVVPIPTWSKDIISEFLERLTLPNLLQSLSTEYTQPEYPPSLGSALKTMSPGLPAREGVEIPTVYFLETLVSPCKNNEFDSNPLSELIVNLLLRITGPLNSDDTLLSGPPSTLIERVILDSSAERMLRPSSSPISSPVTVWTGVLNISSLPVTELSLLLPLYETPWSFIPV